MVEQKEELREYQSVKYIRELTEYWNAYMFALINEIFVGISVNLGMNEKEAYKLSEQNPNVLKKGFFDNFFNKFKNIFPYQISKFRYSKKIFNNGKPMTAQQWHRLNKAIEQYWKSHTGKSSEDITLKAFMLGKKTSIFKADNKNYKFKSLNEVANKLPSDLVNLLSTYDFRNSEKRLMTESLSRVAMHVTESGNGIEEAIRKQVTQGIIDGKSSTKIASDLYWNVEKAGVKGNTAESLRRNWSRISITETQSVYEAGILAPYEDEAAESIKGNGKPQYFIFIGGSCKWCSQHQGTIVRLIPTSFVKDKNNDSLLSMGIKDPNTDIAIWMGKNNVGKYSYKSPEWTVCTPAHPHGVATFEAFDPETQEYDEKTNRVQDKQLYRTKYVPKRKPFEFTEDQKKERLPHFVGPNKVSFNDHIYESVEPGQYKLAYDKWLKDPRQPIPVNINSTSYSKIFEAAEKNKE